MLYSAYSSFRKGTRLNNCNTKCKSCGRKIQFVKRVKNLKKGVDKSVEVWYYNKAVARQPTKRSRKKSEVISGSGPERYQRHRKRRRFFRELIFGAAKRKNKKSFEKSLTNALKCGKINKSPNERKLPKATKDLEN